MPSETQLANDASEASCSGTIVVAEGRMSRRYGSHLSVFYLRVQNFVPTPLLLSVVIWSETFKLTE
jgi:hypothetical protein